MCSRAALDGFFVVLVSIFSFPSTSYYHSLSYEYPILRLVSSYISCIICNTECNDYPVSIYSTLIRTVGICKPVPQAASILDNLDFM